MKDRPVRHAAEFALFRAAEGALRALPHPAARRAGAVVDLPLGPVRYLAVTLLRPDEALFAARGPANRTRLASLLDAAGHGYLSDPERPSVL